MTHSPAPWVWTSDGIPIEVETFKSPGFYDNPKLKAANGITVVGCGGEYMPYENPADARLIAAAPEMLEALRESARLCMLIGDGESKYSGYATQIYARLSAILSRIEGKAR